ncbi:DUF5996 family protein [Aurantiacibacter gangjinensis]|uniref:Uncharacterized protein n=1 Tax=Aurantiacibacter gangjinensis TaxID=502682 RepID=A0A0G9MP82_9SPHN|nr:DUF5996 family protein [Aurantiacibacter gangjinensis]APE28277.1 hypothetical protein BMF35_a1448 [Aurantiacibacter gangjinensis]KLE32520.1 hypothetical protein AAW01_00120 [Aurantiacibacter gangjinensis]
MMESWPSLDYAADKGSYESCHFALQLIGKLPTRLVPWINHGWHLSLQVTPRGYATDMLPGGSARSFHVSLDVIDMAIRVTCASGRQWDVALAGKTIADLHRDLKAALEEAGHPAPLYGAPNEMAERIPFAEDNRPREWDGDALCRLHGAFTCADRVFNRFRSLYFGKTSPSHLFWGSFDLAITRFSGREAPTHPGGIPNLPDYVTREAYSHEVISAGLWPGGGGVDEAAFYAYAYPAPDGLRDQAISPDAAWWHSDLGEWVLTYADVASADDPDALLMAFLQSTYDAAAKALDWPEGLTAPEPVVGRPARIV